MPATRAYGNDAVSAHRGRPASHYVMDGADNFRRRGVKADRLRMVGCGMDSDAFRPDPERAEALRARHNLQES